MKRYKHLYTGIIGELLEDGHLHFDRSDDETSCHETIWFGFIENSEDWVELKPKEYQILSVCTHTYFGISSSSIDIEAFEEDRESASEYTIESVKRLSDGEIFTVGDKIDCKGWFGNIVKIEKCQNNELEIFQQHHIDSYKYKSLSIQELIKFKVPLFRTKDGVEIFEGNPVYGVSKDFQLLYMSYAVKSDNDFVKTFSTKEKAKEYVLMTKPCLSIREIESIVPYYIGEREKLIKIAETKL